MSVESKTDADAAEAVRMTATRNRARIGTLLSLTLLALLVLMWILLSFSTKSFWTYNNITNLLRQGAMTAILAIGETFVIITAGIDLSVGAVVGFTSVIIAMLLTNGFPIWMAIVVTLLLGLAIGVFHAFGIS
jgi:ribose transport system permease protein